MRTDRRHSEAGQTLTLFALMLPVLLGFLALAFEVSFALFEHRHLQTVADTAALVGGQKWTGSYFTGTIDSSGIGDAQSYITKNLLPIENGTTASVNIPPTTGAYAGNSAYIEVTLTHTPTLGLLSAFYASLKQGNSPLVVKARTVARGSRMPLDAAIIALKGSRTGDGSNDVLVKGGGGETIVNGSTYSWGETKNTSGGLTVNGYAMSKGGFQGAITATRGEYSNPPPLYDPKWPAQTPGSATGGHINVGGSCTHPEIQTIYPGTYTDISVGACGTLHLCPGVYQVTGQAGVKLTSNPSVMDLLSPGDIRCPSGSSAAFAGVQIILTDTSAVFQTTAGSVVSLTGAQQYNNVVIWSASEQSSGAVKIVGGSTNNINGTIYCPAGDVSLGGNSSTGVVSGQVVANTVTLTGGSGTAVTYVGDNAAGWPSPVLRE